MCYLIAKKFDEVGCVALQTELGKNHRYLCDFLTSRTLGKGIEILTVSNPEMYGEYKPYHFVASEVEFIHKVYEMIGDDGMKKDPFYSESNIKYLEKKMEDYKEGKLHFEEHELIEDDSEIPNAETIEAIKEVEKMKANPSAYKQYSSFSEVLEELDGEEYTFDQYLAEQLKDEEFKKEWDALQPEMERIRAEIEEDIKKRQC